MLHRHLYVASHRSAANLVHDALKSPVDMAVGFAQAFRYPWPCKQVSHSLTVKLVVHASSLPFCSTKWQDPPECSSIM